MKNIWVFNHYASPPDQPTTGAFYLAKELVKRGNRVTFFASSFNYYKLKDLRIKDRTGKFLVENYGGVDFVWIKTIPYSRNNWRRAFNMLSYAWSAFFIARRYPGSPDIIIGTCPHPLAGLAAYLVARSKKSKFIYEVRDIWPQTLIDEKLISRMNPAAFLLKKLELFLFNQAGNILTVLPALENYIVKLGVAKEKIVWIPNGVDISNITQSPETRINENKIFKVMYIGGHSNYQGLGTLLECAKVLQEEDCRVKFILIGEGSEKASLMNEASRMNLNNVEFRNSIPRDKVYSAMEEADAMIYHIKDISILKYGISSNKLLDYFISQRPVIFAAKCSNNQVEESGAGITVPPEDPVAMSQGIKTLMNSSVQDRIKMGKSGLEYIKKHHDVRMLAARFERELM